MKVKNGALKLVSREWRKPGSVSLMNIGVKTLRNFVKIKDTRNNFQAYQVAQMNTFKVNERKSSKADMMNISHPGLRELLNKFEGEF